MNIQRSLFLTLILNIRTNNENEDMCQANVTFNIIIIDMTIASIKISQYQIGQNLYFKTKMDNYYNLFGNRM